MAVVEQALIVDYPGPLPFAVTSDDINSSGLTSRQWVTRLHPDVPWRGEADFSLRPYRTLVDNRRAKAKLCWAPMHSWRPEHA